MKKVFLSLAALTFVATGTLSVTSCGGSDDKPAPAPAPGPNPDDNPEPTPQEKPELTIKASAATVFLGDEVILSAESEGKDVTSEVTFYKDGVALEGNKLTSDVVGDFSIQAKSEKTEDSNIVKIKFITSPLLSVSGTGTLSHDGVDKALAGGVLFYNGAVSANPNDPNSTVAIMKWSVFVYSAPSVPGLPKTSENTIAVDFTTTGVIETNPQGQKVITEYIKPDANENTVSGFITKFNGDAYYQTPEDGSGVTGTVTFNTPIQKQGNNLNVDCTANVSHNGKTYSFTYTGQVLDLSDNTYTEATSTQSFKSIKPLKNMTPKFDTRYLLKK